MITLVEYHANQATLNIDKGANKLEKARELKIKRLKVSTSVNHMFEATWAFTNRWALFIVSAKNLVLVLVGSGLVNNDFDFVICWLNNFCGYFGRNESFGFYLVASSLPHMRITENSFFPLRTLGRCKVPSNQRWWLYSSSFIDLTF